MGANVDPTDVTRKIAETLGVEASSITLQTTARDVEEWDSVGTMSLLLMLSTNYGIELSPNQTERLQSVAGILELVRAREKASS
jgi:acyl carrier protein